VEDAAVRERQAAIRKLESDRQECLEQVRFRPGAGLVRDSRAPRRAWAFPAPLRADWSRPPPASGAAPEARRGPLPPDPPGERCAPGSFGVEERCASDLHRGRATRVLSDISRRARAGGRAATQRARGGEGGARGRARGRDQGPRHAPGSAPPRPASPHWSHSHPAPLLWSHWNVSTGKSGAGTPAARGLRPDVPLQEDIAARQAALAESGAEQDKTSAELREASLVLEALQLRESVARQAVGELRQARARP
jgi:hypothetical protein